MNRSTILNLLAVPLLSMFAALAAPLAAAADEAAGAAGVETAVDGNAGSAEIEAPGAPWLSLGLGVASLAAYPGSDDRRTVVLPVVSIDLGRFYLGGNANASGGVGMFLVRQPGRTWSLDLNGTLDRPADVSNDLAGFSDRGFGASLGSSYALRVGNFQLGVAAASGLGSDTGNTLRAWLGTQRMVGARWMVGGSLGATLADDRAMAWDFAVDRDDAAGSGLSTYAPGAGLRDVNASLAVTYMIDARLAWTTFGIFQYLGAEAADSPIVRQRGSMDFGMALVRAM